jgi:hypothetical protein
MRVFIYEIKKILRPVTLLILAVFTVLSGFVMIIPNINAIANNYTVEVTTDLIGLIGPKLEPDNQEKIEDAVSILSARYKNDLEAALRAEPLFAQAGVTDYSSFMALQSKIPYSFRLIDEFRAHEEMYRINDQHRGWPPFDPDADYTLTQAEQDIFGRQLTNYEAPRPAQKLRILHEEILSSIESYRYNLQSDEYFYNLLVYRAISPEGVARVREIWSGDEILGILPQYVTYQINGIYRTSFLLILGTLLILLAPIVTKDNMAGVRALQYSSKTGRKALNIQFAAMMFTALIVATIQIAAIFGLFIGRVWHPFLDTGLHSLFNRGTYNWFAGTYWQYFILIFLLMLTLAFAVAMLVFVFSKLSKNYITLLLGIIPLSIVLFSLSFRLFTDPFAVLSDDGFTLYRMIPIPYIEAYICGLLLLIGGMAAGVLLKKQKRAEVV